jgi:hypothetical protein
MKEQTFKVGDRVAFGLKPSTHGTIKSADHGMYLVEWDEFGVTLHGAASLIHLDPPLTIARQAVLDAVKDCPESSNTLRKMFPDVFKEQESKEPLHLANSHDWTSILYRGYDHAPHGLSERCLIVDERFRMEVTEHEGRTILTFFKKS